MLPSRPTRAQRAPKRPAKEESGTDTEPEETPKPPLRTMSKKRLSEMQYEEDASFTSESGRVPLKSVNINDDAAEKRRRRRSAKVVTETDNAEAGPSSDRMDEDPRAGENTRAARQKQQLLSVAQAPVINVPLDVMNSNYEEWMKMATDNVSD